MMQVRDKRKMLITQSRKLAIELRAAIRTKEGLEKQTEDLHQRILEVGWGLRVSSRRRRGYGQGRGRSGPSH